LHLKRALCAPGFAPRVAMGAFWAGRPAAALQGRGCDCVDCVSRSRTLLINLQVTYN